MRDGGYVKVGSLLEFAERFRTEDDCRNFLFARRWPEGFACPRCGGRTRTFIATRHLYQCGNCRYQASLTAGTIMEKTRTPLRVWFYLIYLMANQRTGVSMLGASRMLGIPYKRTMRICGKIRQAMGQRDSLYRLAGIVELDDSYFAAARHGKRGRGTDRPKVLVGVSLTGERPAHARMRVVESLRSAEVKRVLKAGIVEGSLLKTDGLSTWTGAAGDYRHEPVVLGSPEAASLKLPWVHVLIANVKGMLRGVHHGVSKQHLQSYLSEFCWRFSRRYFTPELFDRLLYACITGSVSPVELAQAA